MPRTSKMRVWLNGKISLCQGEDAGSIPATRPSEGWNRARNNYGFGRNFFLPVISFSNDGVILFGQEKFPVF